MSLTYRPLLESLKVISRQIMKKEIEKLSKERYPETIRLTQPDEGKR